MAGVLLACQLLGIVAMQAHGQHASDTPWRIIAFLDMGPLTVEEAGDTVDPALGVRRSQRHHSASGGVAMA